MPRLFLGAAFCGAAECDVGLRGAYSSKKRRPLLGRLIVFKRETLIIAICAPSVNDRLSNSRTAHISKQ